MYLYGELMFFVLGIFYLEVVGVVVLDKVVVEFDYFYMIFYLYFFVDGVDVFWVSVMIWSEVVDIRCKFCGNVSFLCNFWCW